MPDKPPSMAEIARRAGVSKNTVSLALRHDRQIPQETRDRIARIARELGYNKNATVARLMAELRRGKAPRFRSCLAVVNAHADRNAFRTHPTIPTYIEGCRRRAAALGYRLDEFWLHEPSLDGIRLNKVLRARGIMGVIVVGLMGNNRLPDRFLPTWQSFPTVVTGVRTHEPALSFACTDHHMLALAAFRKALALGYQRPALVIDPVIDELVEHRITAGVQVAQRALPRARRVRTFLPPDDSPGSEAGFHEWREREHPDVILTLYNNVRRWLEKRRFRVPRDIGLIQLEWRSSSPDWAGMNQHNDVVGEAAVEMVIGMIHNNESGIPAFPRATLIDSSWVDGSTVKTRLPPAR
ncbi:LacI family DNA-binding transcriptional regulator [Terrimicrobium sacchariphilum]|nr:LacI family DNA-binding transcriptional regulator [Terrimicrobium sacchariphilum]